MPPRKQQFLTLKKKQMPKIIIHTYETFIWTNPLNQVPVDKTPRPIPIMTGQNPNEPQQQMARNYFCSAAK